MPERKTKTPIDPKYGHLQPQATDLERVVLGALMIDKDAFSIVSELLRPETFYEPRNEKVYRAIQTLSLAEKPVDIMTVTEELKHEGTLEEVGGPAYIVDLSSHVASSAHIEYHARILAQKYLARQLITFASIIETKAFDETVDVDELMQEAEGSLHTDRPRHQTSHGNPPESGCQYDWTDGHSHRLFRPRQHDIGLAEFRPHHHSRPPCNG